MRHQSIVIKTHIILAICIYSLITACDKGKELDFSTEGEGTEVLTFDCGDAIHALELDPGKYAVKAASDCKDTLVVNDQKHALDKYDIVFKIQEGDKASLLCKGGDGKCTLTYVRVDEELAAGQRNYLPSMQLGTTCDVDEVLILKALTDDLRVRLFYKPCVFGHVEIRVKDETNTSVVFAGGSSPKLENLWFSLKKPLELKKDYTVTIKCVAGENSTGNCMYAIGWRK